MVWYRELYKMLDKIKKNIEDIENRDDKLYRDINELVVEIETQLQNIEAGKKIEASISRIRDCLAELLNQTDYYLYRKW